MSHRNPIILDITKQNNRLAGAILFECFDGERLAVLLGSTTECGVGFALASVSDTKNFGELQALFNPQTAGTTINLEHQRVRIDMSPPVRGGVKYYLVDMILETLHRGPSTFKTILETDPGPRKLPGGRFLNAVEALFRGFRTSKPPLKSP